MDCMKPILPTTLFFMAISMAPAATAADCPASSSAELAQKFERAFKGKDEASLLALFTWKGVEPDLQAQLKRQFTGMLSKTFIRAEVQDGSLEANEAKQLEASGLYLNVVPVATLYFERSVGSTVIDPREKTAGRLAIGKLGNCFSLGAYTKQKP